MRNVMIGLFAFAVCLLAFVMGAAIRDFTRPAPKPVVDCCQPKLGMGCRCCEKCPCVTCGCVSAPPGTPSLKCSFECKCKVAKKPGAVGDKE